jgi:hypothetical protein
MANIASIITDAAVKTSTRGLDGTAKLTSLAKTLADEFINNLGGSAITDEELADALKNNDQLDNIIRELTDLRLYADDSAFIEALDPELATKMLKSQQSKRSRCKNKQMTASNFSNLITAAIAEMLLRDYCGLTKHAGSGAGRRGSVGYTDEELDALAADQEALRKALRNVQSKKSIMKSKAGFDAESAAWQELLEVEQQLKDRRVKAPRSVRVDETKSALSEMLTDVDVKSLTKGELAELIASIQGLTTE